VSGFTINGMFGLVHPRASLDSYTVSEEILGPPAIRPSLALPAPTFGLVLGHPGGKYSLVDFTLQKENLKGISPKVYCPGLERKVYLIVIIIIL
jgi:hypothetical protein